MTLILYPQIVLQLIINICILARFYNKLPEVKRQREEEKRKNAYSTNRDKAKEYQEVL